VVVRRVELPIQEVLELPLVDAQQFGSGLDTDLGADRFGLDEGDLDHVIPGG
jgi:hypothetical protein